jgi:hypothetical protein
LRFELVILVAPCSEGFLVESVNRHIHDVALRAVQRLSQFFYPFGTAKIQSLKL